MKGELLSVLVSHSTLHTSTPQPTVRPIL